MTFDEITTMDDETLNRTIDEYCTDHLWQWIPDDTCTGGRWYLEHPDIQGRMWSSVPHLHYTASWDRVMTLWHTHGQEIDLAWAGWEQPPQVWVTWQHGPRRTRICTTEAQIRRGLCELILWRTLRPQEEEKDAHE